MNIVLGFNLLIMFTVQTVLISTSLRWSLTGLLLSTLFYIHVIM